MSNTDKEKAVKRKGRKAKATDIDFFKDFLGVDEKQFVDEYFGLEKSQQCEAWKVKTGKEIEKYGKWLEAKGYKYSSARQMAYEVNGYLASKHGIKGLEVNLPMQGTQGNNGRKLTDDEISKLYHACDVSNGEHCKLMSLVEWGLRPSDVVKLKRSEVKEQFETLTQKEKVMAHPSCTRELLDELSEYWKAHPNSDFAFNGTNGDRITERGLNSMLTRLCKQTGIDPTGITCKAFRKWVWDTLKNLSVPEDERCYYIGKANDKSHDVYSLSWKQWYPKFAEKLSEIRKVHVKTIDKTPTDMKALLEYLGAVREWAKSKGFADFPTPPSIVQELLGKGDMPTNSIKPLFIV